MTEEKDDSTFSIKIPSPLRVRGCPQPRHIQFFLDYDDTLVPSSLYMNCKRNMEVFSRNINLKKFDDCLYEFLRLLMANGSVTIITGSENGWAELSGAIICPKSIQLLSSIPIVALGIHQGDDAMKKKYDAMCSCVDKNVDVLVSIGDSNAERYSAWKLRDNYPIPKVLTVKMKEHPNGDEMILSLKYLRYWIIHMICSTTRDITISTAPYLTIEERIEDSIKKLKLEETHENEILTARA
jgi:hypothetical protein